MRISLIGYGKMGKAIEKIALERGHEISFRISRTNIADLSKINSTNTDVAIEFTQPGAAVGNIRHCLQNGVSVVCGTTGWLEKWEEIRSECTASGGTLLYASNFSLGVNIFFELNKFLARMMSEFPYYKASIEEIHHTQKLDAPSGTAITLAKDIIMQNSNYSGWEKEKTERDDIIPVKSLRLDPAPGTHTVSYDFDIDTIEIRHTAHSRTGFAGGAVQAAEWLQGRKGIFTMQDMLGFSANI